MEFVDAIGELKALPEGTHLLCPRQNENDYGRYDDLSQVDEDGKSIKDIVTEAKIRLEKFLLSMRILAYNADGVEELQTWVLSRLDQSLEKCDLCIKQYYTGKVWLMDQLKEEYQEEDIEAFSQRVDEWDIKRITRNLTTATTQLKKVAPQDINLSVLDRAALLSIFETLSCEAMLRSDDLLQKHFDEPFKLIQTKRSLKISDYVPAVTHFLFDSNQLRSFWAISTWTRYTRSPTRHEFEWAIRDGLLSALQHGSQAANQLPPELAVIQRLWRGMQLIVRKLDKDQITHNLRALEIDPCRLSVDHLHLQTPGLRFLLNTIQTFLEKAPGDFWDAMQTISPQAIAEHTFYNFQFKAFLMQTTEGEPYEKSALKDMLSWITPFLASLKGHHQPSACRYLATQLLQRLQDPQYPNLSRYHCFHVGLNSLLSTLRRFTDHEASRSSVDRVVLKETMDVVVATINVILDPPVFDIEKGRQEEINSLCMDVVRNTLALECQSLKSDYEVILKHGTLSHGVSTYSAPIWDAVIKHLHQDNLALSTAALLGILPLVGLEKFPTKGEDNKEKTHFNMIYGHLTHLSCQMIERLADFSPEHLKTLFQSQDTSSALISTLFAADLNTYQAAVDLIKNVSGQFARRDAISYLLESFFTTSMYGMSWSFRRISNMKTFAPAPRMLHTGTDIVEILCNSQTGMLRTRNFVDRREVLSLQKLWEFLWQSLTTIFDETEAWHLRGNDKTVMLDFCRDTMQFANFLFDQYGVFLGAVGGADTAQKSISENFIKSPTTTMSAMVKWLRLKDEYLATTLVGLVSKILRRLGSLDVTTVKADALSFIEGVAVHGTIKTILTNRDKAELVRSLEAYTKKPVVTASTASMKKQSSITSFARPSDISSPSSRAPSEDDFEDIPDQTLLDLSRSVELNKDRLALAAKQKGQSPSAMQALTALKTRPAVSKGMIAPRPKDDATSVLSFREKREREKEAKKKRDMVELARLKKNLPARGVAEQTAEQGSGLKGIGVKGKDHAVPAESMMVSSGSDTDTESEDELDKELFGEKPKKPDAVAAYEQSKKKSLQQMPVKKVKRHRSMKDMRARLSPDLSTLHHTILSWDFFASGDLPPTSDRTDYTLVSNSFRSPMEYQNTFKPLLILEAWQGFQQAKEEGMFRPFEVKVMTRLTVDSWIEISTQPLGLPPKDFSMGEGDLVLFSSAAKPHMDQNAGHILARVSHVNRKGGKMEVTYRMNPGTNKFLSSFGVGATVWGVKVTSLTPVEREYGALMALEYYDLCEEIVLAKPSPILNYGDLKLQPIMENYDINRAQAKAIKSAMDNDAFTLIQGPPGSGKTKTITALVGSLLTNSLSNTAVSIGTGHSADKAARAASSKKVLVCAPSNAAVDELVMRMKDGVKTIHGRQEKISVIRLGRSDAINAKVLDVTLDEMVNARLSQTPAASNNVDMQKLYEEHKKTDTQFKHLRASLDECRAKGIPAPEELEREFELMKKKRTQLSADIDKARDHVHTLARNADMNKRRIQQEIIDGAHVICTTLSGSGHDMFQSMNVEFESVIIDEAAQCIELSALIPLKYGCSKCVLVGDPKQLPPTVLSKMASRFQYEQSLFVRMQKNFPRDVHLLDIQYRMHPDISLFPSLAFYDGKLQDGPGMGKLRIRPWHQSELLSPYRFFDVQGMHQSATKGHSLINYAELQVAMQLYDRLVTDVRDYDFAGKIGIITPYKGQLREMKIQFAARYGEDILKKVDFNTTDAFQGRESEVIIFSCVRASNKGIGFLADIRRMNVGLTRAKSSLWVLGNSRSLMQGEFWNGLINNARERNVYTEGNIPKLLEKPQFTGYRDIEMLDADLAANVATPTVSTPLASPFAPASRPSSASTGLDSRSVSVSASGPGTPMPRPDGPSGGAAGLDESKMCGVCGSNEHFTHNCDNAEAKEAARGKCYRCGEFGHTKFNCTAERCLECGQCGHSATKCKATKPLSKHEKSRVAHEERRRAEQQKQNADRQRQRQMGGHDPKIPTIAVTTHSPSVPHENPGSKRKRTEGAPDGPPAARPRTGPSKPASGPPPTAPKGPRAPAPPGGLIKPSRDRPAYPPPASKPSSSGGPSPPGSNAADALNPPQPKPRPPVMRKKKEADPFIRPKPRRK
ncbi:tRNA-splicing endonuclease [Penicillium canariense]|uniref:tRNA-splicing endonuclease n=1 Tax=Penicillium canariense TaxID=189055 RepID=A0A9W9LMX6_9EURO|nr:tRNA-splicing endonuclease [Penicillium canariense]KAJ5166118.1 tRNA-splicing endonuclease [Penicillium canariense]